MQDRLEILIMVFLGLAVGVSVRALSPARGGITMAVLIGLYWAIGFYAFCAWNWILPLVGPTLVVALTYTGNTVYHFMVERREHRRVQRFLSSYVSKNVAKRLLESGEDISFKGERAQITTVFSDIRGFTSLSERLSPDDVVRTLNDYFGEMTEVIFHNDGTLDKFMGDAIMVFFGHPDPQPDHALRALRTAVQMQEKMKLLQERWTIEGREAIGIGIGVNTGAAVVGNIGTDYKTEYTAIGDHVNVAFRIQGLAEVGEILITEDTYRLVRDQVEVKSREPVAVKGKSEPLRIYQVIGLKEGGQSQVS
jgi:adenylate cyclase